MRSDPTTHVLDELRTLRETYRELRAGLSKGQNRRYWLLTGRIEALDIAITTLERYA